MSCCKRQSGNTKAHYASAAALLVQKWNLSHPATSTAGTFGHCWRAAAAATAEQDNMCVCKTALSVCCLLFWCHPLFESFELGESVAGWDSTQLPLPSPLSFHPPLLLTVLIALQLLGSSLFLGEWHMDSCTSTHNHGLKPSASLRSMWKDCLQLQWSSGSQCCSAIFGSGHILPCLPLLWGAVLDCVIWSWPKLKEIS